jgi:hypothetical protein
MLDTVNGAAPQAAAPPPAEAKSSAPVRELTIDLEFPVMAHGDTVKKLTFRRPTGGDLMAMGAEYPIVIDWTTGRVTPHPECMGRMMGRLADVPPSTIKSMDAMDFATCAHALMPFFPPGAQAMQY